MAHQRKIIRAAVADILVSASTAAGSRVYPSRRLPLRRLELPAIAVYTTTDTVSDGSAATAPRELQRQLSLVVECCVSATQDEAIDDLLDDIAEEVEAALHADPYFGDTCSDSVLADTSIDLDDSGDRLVGVVQLTYTVTYYQLAPAAPELVDWRVAEIDYSLSGELEYDDQAHDELVLQVAVSDAPAGFGTDEFGEYSFGE